EELFLPAQGDRGRLPGLVEVLPQPQALLAERAPRAGGQESGGVAQRRRSRALAGTVGLPAFLPGSGRLSGGSIRPLRAAGGAPAHTARRRGCRATDTLKWPLLNHAPNWRYNTLTITGPEDRVAAFVRRAETNESALSYSAFVPEPEYKGEGDWHAW